MDILTGQTGERFIIAIVAVGLALAVFAGVLWFIRNRPVAPLLTRSPKARQKRLSVIDATIVDTRHRLVLVRRDNVEHLILVGGPQDLVVESGIAVSATNSAHFAEEEPHQQEYAAPPQPRQAQQQPAAARKAPRPPQPLPMALPEEANNFTYGPDAVLSAKDFAPEPVQRETSPDDFYDALAKAAGAASDKPADVASALTEANAESIIAMLRARMLGDDDQPPARQAATPQPQRQPSAAQPAQTVYGTPEPAATPRNTAFSRVLDGNPEPGDLPREAQPTVKPAHNWSPAMQRLNPAKPRTELDSPQKRESLKREQMLELEMARILEEMQMRRSK